MGINRMQIMNLLVGRERDPNKGLMFEAIAVGTSTTQAIRSGPHRPALPNKYSNLFLSKNEFC